MNNDYNNVRDCYTEIDMAIKKINCGLDLITYTDKASSVYKSISLTRDLLENFKEQLFRLSIDIESDQ